MLALVQRVDVQVVGEGWVADGFEQRSIEEVGHGRDGHLGAELWLEGDRAARIVGEEGREQLRRQGRDLQPGGMGGGTRCRASRWRSPR